MTDPPSARETIVALSRIGDVVVAELNSPPVNAIDGAMREALAGLAQTVMGDETIRVVVLRGSDRIFAAGADVTFLANASYEQIVGWNRRLQRVFTEIAELPVPVIAAVTGHALGGGLELALAADFRIASANATVGLPEVQLGILPGAGGTQRLTRMVGASRAKALIMTGERLDAASALELGLVDEVVTAEQTVERAVEMAQDLAAGPKFAIAAIKEAVNCAARDSSSGLALERALLAGMFATPDRITGMRSFLENGPGQARFD